MIGLEKLIKGQNVENLITNLKKELLNAEIDLKSSTIIEGQKGAITVTAAIHPARFVFAALFALPCLFFIKHVIFNPIIMNFVIALIICPPLCIMAVLLGGVIAEKNIDPYRKKAKKVLRLFSFKTEESLELALKGVITLTWKWSKSGHQTKGYNKFIVTVSPGKGLVFITFNDYPAALAFAKRLSVSLSFPLENAVPQANQN